MTYIHDLVIVAGVMLGLLIWALIGLGVIWHVLSMFDFRSGYEDCTGDCNQGRDCNCGGHRDNHMG